MKRAAPSLDGKVHLEGRPLPRFAEDRDSTLVPSHDPENGCQAKATTGELGRKIRIENPGLSGFIDSATGVAFPREGQSERFGAVAAPAAAAMVFVPVEVAALKEAKASANSDPSGFVCEPALRVFEAILGTPLLASSEVPVPCVNAA